LWSEQKMQKIVSVGGAFGCLALLLSLSAQSAQIRNFNLNCGLLGGFARYPQHTQACKWALSCKDPRNCPLAIPGENLLNSLAPETPAAPQTQGQTAAQPGTSDQSGMSESGSLGANVGVSGGVNAGGVNASVGANAGARAGSDGVGAGAGVNAGISAGGVNAGVGAGAGIGGD
jgi:hypothetical protein